MQFVYFDEAGTANPKEEPILVVTGVVVDADVQWMKARNRLREITEDFFEGEVPEGALLHAKDIFGGAGHFPRSKYSLAKRLGLLRSVLAVTDELTLPIVYGSALRNATAVFPDLLSLGQAFKNNYAHMMCFLGCVASIERLLRDVGHEEEVATLVFENSEESKAMVKRVHKIMSDRNGMKLHVPVSMQPFFPVTRIVDTTHFCLKDEAPLLQIADAASFCLRRYIAKSPHWEAIADILPRSGSVHRPSLDRNAWVSAGIL